MTTNYNIVWSNPKLDGELDFNYWEKLMSTHFKAHNIWNFIEPDLKEGADDAAKRKDQLELSQIYQGVDFPIFGKIADAKNAKDTWEKLKLSCKGVEKAQKIKLQSICREYKRYFMSNSETVEQYFSRVQDLVNKMRVYGEDISDGNVMEKILRTMPIKFDHVVTTVIDSHDLDKMTVEKLQGSIESHNSRILEKTEKVNEEALKTQVNFNNVAKSSKNIDDIGHDYNNGERGNYRGRGRGNFRGRGRGNFSHGRDNYNKSPIQGRGGNNFWSSNRGRGGGNNFQERNNFNCYNCGKFGRRAAACRSRHQANIVEYKYDNAEDNTHNPQSLFYTSNTLSEEENVWYLDIGCSFICVGKRSCFVHWMNQLIL